MIGDLHIHTRFSDGSMGIDDVVFYAKRAGLDFIAITDHDTMAGCTRGRVVGERIGIQVLAGVELSCFDRERGRKVHLLCYLPQRPQALEGLFHKVLESRTRAGKEMIQQVMRYYPVTMELVNKQYSGSTAIYKQHIMLALMELGYDKEIFGRTFHTLFDKKTGLCRVEVEYPDVRLAAHMAQLAKGICVLAHPSVYHSLDLMWELAREGLIHGIEIHHPRNRREDLEQMLQCAQEFHLIVTGGTDFHGSYSKEPNPLGTCVTTQQSLEQLFALNQALE